MLPLENVRILAVEQFGADVIKIEGAAAGGDIGRHVPLGGRVPVAPVRSMREALDPGELAQRDLLAEYEHPVFGRVRSRSARAGPRPKYWRVSSCEVEPEGGGLWRLWVDRGVGAAGGGGPR